MCQLKLNICFKNESIVQAYCLKLSKVLYAAGIEHNALEVSQDHVPHAFQQDAMLYYFSP